MPSFIVYSEKIVKRDKPKVGEIVLTRKNHLDAIETYAILYEKHGIILARVERGLDESRKPLQTDQP